MPILKAVTQAAGQDLGPSALAEFRGIILAPAASGTLFSRLLGSGAKMERKWWSELVTVDAAATSYSTSTIPAYAAIICGFARVTVTIPDATSVDFGNEGGGSFISGTDLSASAGSSIIGVNALPRRAATTAGRIYITPDAVPSSNTGRIRVGVIYEEFTPPTS